MSSHWAQPYIGKPWVSMARGPEAFDCWGLVWYIYKNDFGISLPDMPHLDLDIHIREIVRRFHDEFSKDKPQSVWTPLSVPEDKCVVCMSQREEIHHVGVWLSTDGGLVLHAKDKGNVAAESIAGLRMQGINKTIFYRHELINRPRNLHQESS